jgi:hypothetical protein
MVSQPKQAVKTIIILSSGDWVRVPEGSNPDRYRREQEARLARPSGQLAFGFFESLAPALEAAR